jgi:uncharacterized protein with HEPN domain
VTKAGFSTYSLRRKVLTYTKGMDEEHFRQNELVRDAVLRQIAIVGEAAGKVSREYRDAHPELPWHDMIGMRHRLVHDYFRVDAAKVWDKVQFDIPPLVAQLEPLVPPDEPDKSSRA